MKDNVMAGDKQVSVRATKHQFVHIESYGRKAGKTRSKNGHRSAADVIDEMIRRPHASPHVKHPQAPTILEGDPGQALVVATEMAEQARDPLGRKLRQDAHIISVCVCAYPIPNNELVGPDAVHELDRWINSTLDWARKEFGVDQLKAAVLHRDEGYPHLHLVCVPPAIGVEPSPLRRASKAALAKAKDKDRPRRIERNAFKQAGRDLQDSFYHGVSCHFGHQRLGVNRRKRLSPEQRRLELTQARALLTTRRKADFLAQQTQLKIRAQEDAASRNIANAYRDLQNEKSAFCTAKAAWQKRAALWTEHLFQQEKKLRKEAAILGLRMKPILERLLNDALARSPAGTRRWIEPIVADVKRKLGALLEAGQWTERVDESVKPIPTSELGGWSMPRR